MAARHLARNLNPTWEQPWYATSYKAGPRSDRSWLFRPSLMLWSPPVYVFRAGYSCWTGDRSWENTDSGRYNVEYVSAGSARFTQQGQTHVVKAGSVFLVRKRGRHRFAPGPSGYLHKRYVGLAGPMLDLMLESLGLAGRDVVPLRDHSWFPGFFKRTATALAIPGESRAKNLLLSALAYELLTVLADSAATTDLPPLVSTAMEYMNRNLTRPLTMRQVADQTGVGINHLTRLFTSATRQSPMKYYADRRVAYARTLLEDTTLSIKEISALLGFRDPLYFSTLFKRYVHCSPREYRKRTMAP